MVNTEAKILVFDIETKPLQAYVWGLWKQNVGLNMIEEDWSVLTWAAKWLGKEEVLSDTQLNHKEPGENFDTEDDFDLVQSLWHLLHEADIVITHNGKRFDIPKMNARFLYHELPPPSPYRIIDTLTVAKGAFKFTSNKLDYIANHLGVGSKLDTGGFELWNGCMKGDVEAWDRMLEYNIQDVHILESVYMKLRPWAKPHPNLSLYDDKEGEYRCPTCGSTHVHKRGFYMTNVGRYQRYKCTECETWSRARTTDLPKEKRASTLTNVA